MGPGVKVMTLNHRFSGLDVPMQDQGVSAPKSVNVGDDVWLGEGAVLLPGTQIGSHSIVGAFSVVRGDFLEWSIIAGNPAKVVGIREDRSAMSTQAKHELVAEQALVN